MAGEHEEVTQRLYQNGDMMEKVYKAAVDAYYDDPHYALNHSGPHLSYFKFMEALFRNRGLSNWEPQIIACQLVSAVSDRLPKSRQVSPAHSRMKRYLLDNNFGSKVNVRNNIINDPARKQALENSIDPADSVHVPELLSLTRGFGSIEFQMDVYETFDTFMALNTSRNDVRQATKVGEDKRRDRDRDASPVRKVYTK